MPANRPAEDAHTARPRQLQETDSLLIDGQRAFTSRPLAKPDAMIQDQHWRITILHAGVLRLEWSPVASDFEDRASTFAIYRDLETPAFQVLKNTDELLELKTDRFRLSYNKQSFSPAGLSVSITGEMFPWRFAEQGSKLTNLGGTARTLDEVDGRISLGPGILSKDGIACLDDSESMLFTDDGWIAPRKERCPTGATSSTQRQDLYIFAFGRDYYDALKAFYAISGPQPVIPRWALGNWWSRYHPYSQHEYLELMDRFARREIPLSVGIQDMDWHRVHDVPKEHGSGWTGYSWNKNLFEDPKAFVDALHQRGLKTALNDHPADGVRAFEDDYATCAKFMGLPADSKEAVEFDVTDRRFVKMYFDVLRAGIEKQTGVDFWWLDWQQGPFAKQHGIDPLWVLNHFDFLSNAKHGRHPISFSRFAGPGSHRYPVGFSGDTIVTWQSLAFQPEFTACASNIGYGLWSHDIGGHMFGKRDDELAARWVQLGVFSPINRLHSTLSNFNRKEPWLFDLEAEKTMTAMLKLRHQLVPYIFSMVVRATQDHVPIVEPLYYRSPHDERAYKYPNVFYFGTDLLVAPITAPRNAVTRLGRADVWLPPGRWLDLMTECVYDGDVELALHRPIDQIPVLAKEGTILVMDPMGDLVLGALANIHAGYRKNKVVNGCPWPDVLHVCVIPGKDGEAFYYEDNDAGGQLGETVTLEPMRFDWNQENARLLITTPKTFDMKGRLLTLCLVGCSPQADALRNIKLEPGACQPFHFGKPMDWNAEKPWPALQQNDSVARCFDILDRAHTVFAAKEALLSILKSGKPLANLVSCIHATTEADQALKEAVLEILLASENEDIDGYE